MAQFKQAYELPIRWQRGWEHKFPKKGLAGEFERAYDITSKWEGGWVHNPDDLGEETYAGISRKHNPDWPGWAIVDQHRPLKWNETIWDQSLIALVEDFYRDSFSA